MPFFIDTNIALGYTVIHDQWHETANNFINNTHDNIFWSNLVQEEYTNKLDDLLDEMDLFLKTTEKILKNNDKDFVSYYDFERYVLKRTRKCILDNSKKQRILEHFWIKYNIFEGIAESTYLKFRNYNKNFKKMYFKRDKNLNKNLILHNCGLNNYKRYRSYADKLKKWGIHSPDNKIITDAHDCGLKNKNLIFVSSDVEMVDTILEHNHSFLSIVEFKSCN